MLQDKIWGLKPKAEVHAITEEMNGPTVVAQSTIFDILFTGYVLFRGMYYNTQQRNMLEAY